MKRNELINIAISVVMVIAVVVTGKYFGSQIQFATTPVVNVMLGHSVEAVVGMIAGIAVLCALGGYFVCRFGRWVYKSYGEMATDALTSFISAALVIVVFFGAIPGGLSVVWLIAMFVGAFVAAWRA